MFYVRPAQAEDTPDLLRLARTMHSGNLPADSIALQDRIEYSRECFAGCAPHGEHIYMFVLVDGASNRVAGTSSLVTGKGTVENPRLFLRVKRREHYSDDLQTGQLQVTLQLGRDHSGPTELGGLVLGAPWRGLPQRLGSFLSKVRFAYIGMHPDRFDRRLIGEIMGDLTADGRTMLWDHLGRRFINLSYTEADAFSRTSKEFITSLFPQGEIHVSLLPAEARRLIGRVAPDARAAMRMLERQGFKHCDEVDPFDGGPYVEAERDEIPLVRMTESKCLADSVPEIDPTSCIVMTDVDGAGMLAVQDDTCRNGSTVSVSAAAMELLGVSIGDNVTVTPLWATDDTDDAS